MTLHPLTEQFAAVADEYERGQALKTGRLAKVAVITHRTAVRCHPLVSHKTHDERRLPWLRP
jgi:hypothetical protein